MTKAIAVVRGIAGFTWLAQLALGIAFLTGHALGSVTLHMQLGVLFVLAMWTLAILCARDGAPAGFVAFTVGWGALVAALGWTQVGLLVGPLHWIVRVVHLLVGLAAMPIAGRLSMTTRTASITHRKAAA